MSTPMGLEAEVQGDVRQKCGELQGEVNNGKWTIDHALLTTAGEAALQVWLVCLA